MKVSPSSSPAPKAALPANLQNPINHYCSDPNFKEKFERLRDAVTQENIFAQPIKAMIGAPILAGFFANFIALYALLKIYSINESDRVRYQGSPYATTREPAIAGVNEAFEDFFSNSLKAFGFDSQSYRISLGPNFKKIVHEPIEPRTVEDFFKNYNLDDVNKDIDGMRRQVAPGVMCI